MPLTIGLLLPEKMPREKIHRMYGQTALHRARMESIFRLSKEETVTVAQRYRFSSPSHLAQKELPTQGCWSTQSRDALLGHQHPLALPTAPLVSKTMKVINTWKGFLVPPQACVTELSTAAGSGGAGLPRAVSPLWEMPPLGLLAWHGLQLIPNPHLLI